MSAPDAAAATLSIIIPSFNEAATLPQVIEQVERAAVLGLKKEIIVVDDGSSDDTAKLLAGSLAGRVSAVSHSRNRGKGAAVRSGLAVARGTFVLIQDADLEHDPSRYEALLQPLLAGSADVVFGSRFLPQSNFVTAYAWQRPANRLATTLINAVSKPAHFSDAQSGQKAFRREIADKLHLKEDRFGFDPEFSIKVARLGLRIAEVPISVRSRTFAAGRKNGWRDGLEVGWVVFKYGLLRAD